jgi:D-glycero-D-manno-heptose 1,7-bisphosphate phosphatase
MKSKALFLDRDGVINKEINYLFRIDDFIFVEGIFDLCINFQNNGYKIFVITNQSGIARGHYNENDFKKLSDLMIREFILRNIFITKVYHCPHYPPISGICKCRKPNPGMIEKAQKEFDLDLSNSILIGDKISDIEAGKNAGVGLNILIPSDIISNKLFKLESSVENL